MQYTMPANLQLITSILSVDTLHSYANNRTATRV